MVTRDDRSSAFSGEPCDPFRIWSAFLIEFTYITNLYTLAIRQRVVSRGWWKLAEVA
jgi:hypothetical protein